MAKQYIGSDEHWIDSINQRYDENERHSIEQMQEQEDNRVQCWKTYLECENYEHYNKNQSCKDCDLFSTEP